MNAEFWNIYAQHHFLVHYYLFCNLFTFFLFAYDKRQAIRSSGGRIPNKLLLGLSLAGGVFGGVAAMRIFRHKTKTRLYLRRMPMMLIVHTVLIYSLIVKAW